MRRRTALAILAVLALLIILGGRWRAEPAADPSAIATPPADAHAAITGPARAAALALPTGASVSGRVTFADEPAIAQVCLTAAELVIASETFGGQQFGLPMHCAATDERGHYRIAALAAGRYQLSASAPGYISLLHHEDPPQRWIVLARDQARVGLDLAFTLRGVPVTGIVRDVAGGTIAGATVSELDGGLAMTGEDGEFTLWVAPGSRTVLGAFAPGYTTDTAVARPPQAPLILYLSPESVLRGRVVQADTGAPLSDLPVHVQSDQRTDATTDADGSFEIRGLDPGRFKPFVRHAGWCGSANGPLGLGIGETSEPLTIAATRCATVTAQVRGTASGPPCPSAQVELLDAVGDPVRRAFTDLSGEITLSGLASGAYGVRITCPGHFQRAPESWLFDDAHPTRVTWEVEPARTIRGQVRDHHGQPVALAVLSAVGSWGFVDSRSDADGKFTLTGVQPGSVEITALHFDHLSPAPITLDIAEATDPAPIVLRLLASASIVGRVRARVGELPSGLTIVTRTIGNFAATSQRVPPDGTFVVTGLQPLPHQITVQRLNHLVARQDSSELFEPVIIDLTTQDRVEVELIIDVPKPGTLDVRVEASDGEPEPDALITVDSPMLRHRGLTDEAGRLTLAVPDRDAYTVEVTARDGQTIFKKDVHPGAPLLLRFPATRRVCGRVRTSEFLTDEDQSAIGDFTVQTDQGAAEGFSATDRWCLDHVPVGARTFSARSPGFGTASAPLRVPAAGTIADLTLQFTGRSALRGDVRDGAGQPRVAFKVWVFDDTGRLVGGNLYTDAAGAFALDGAPAGKLTVVPIPPGPMLPRERLLASGTTVQVIAGETPDPVVLIVP